MSLSVFLWQVATSTWMGNFIDLANMTRQEERFLRKDFHRNVAAKFRVSHRRDLRAENMFRFSFVRHPFERYEFAHIPGDPCKHENFLMRNKNSHIIDWPDSWSKLLLDIFLKILTFITFIILRKAIFQYLGKNFLQTAKNF